ncbi:hypothetical protein QT979_21475 [Microcoleus sp. w2-18bC1]|uniref:hypothetical protein n=1 Tax=unclassified Microcoleus TaxID=2642155 RepID=UPI002FD11959
MALLECVKPGAKLGQIIFAVDEFWITKERSPNCSMQAIAPPKFKYCLRSATSLDGTL